jgi:phosphatidylserine/phosphatidylglycerophosphate/cardiolipin synthase-like enzyme
MKHIFTLLLSLTIFFSSIIIAQTVPIASIKINDSNGVPLDTGQVFTISGIVNSSNQFGNDGPGTVQDETAGISIFGSGFTNQVNIGDSVTVTSVLSQFRGLTEFDFFAAGSNLVVHTSGHKTEPTVVTIAQIINQQWNGFEEFESLLIRINNVSIQASGNFASGTNYNITDATGTLAAGLRIDNNVSSIIGQPIPSSTIDIIGVLGQFDFSPPYSSGYQILPRFIFDIVDDGAPLILNPVIAANIDTNSFTVYFNTARNGNSQVKYGLTPDLEIDSVVINTDTTVHVIPITGLQEATRYYYRAYSTNQNGTSISSLQTVTTASSDPTIGTINVYFNFSVDTTVAMASNSAKGNVNFEQKLMDRINQANHSIDLALYSFFGMPNIANALVTAKSRDVKVRVVYDNRQTQNSMQTLINAGIPVLKRHSGLDGIMHNKFFIFDARDTVIANDWLWTGSWNVTSTELTWKNNVIEINDPTITAAYQIEFEEMWGSSGDLPNSANAKFAAHHDIYFAMYAFTRSDISTAMSNRFNAGITDIRGLIDQPNTTGSEYNFLNTFAEMYTANGNTQHHKYGIVDATSFESNPTTITGSQNWSNAGESRNDENTLIIDDVYIANQFMQEFKKRYNEAGGTNPFITPTSTDEYGINEISYQLEQNYPNPFNPVTTIKYSIPSVGAYL